MQNVQLEVQDEYDKEFIILVLEIEKRYSLLDRHTRLRIETWVYFNESYLYYNSVKNFAK